MTRSQQEDRANRTDWNRYRSITFIVGIGVIGAGREVLQCDRKYDDQIAELRGSDDYATVRNLNQGASDLGKARDYTGAPAADCSTRVQEARMSLIAAARKAKSADVREGALENAQKCQPKLCSGNPEASRSLTSRVEDLGRKEAEFDPNARAVEASIGEQIHDQGVFRMGMFCLAGLGILATGLFGKKRVENV